MDLEALPPQLRVVLRSLETAVRSREPAIAARVAHLRARHPNRTGDQLARELIRVTRRRVAATGALSGAAAVAPGLGTLLAIGTITSQSLYALEQEVELVLGIAMLYGHDLRSSDDRVVEALAVVGIAGGALKLHEDVLVAGARGLVATALARVATGGAARLAARLVPLGVGIGVGAGVDWVTVTGLGRAAMRYYGPGGRGARPLLLTGEDAAHVELGG